MARLKGVAPKGSGGAFLRLGFRVLGFRVWGLNLGFRVKGFRLGFSTFARHDTVLTLQILHKKVEIL